jgi:protoheme IX farnesyltransferase
MTLASSSTNDSLVPLQAASAGPAWVRSYMELTKARLSTLVVFTTAVGFVAAVGWTADWVALVSAVLGTAMCAGCASVLNQVIERRRDAQMDRTRNRPLPAGDVSVRHALVLAAVLGVGGLGLLLAGTNAFAMGLAALTIFIYAGIYTPMKTRSPLNTLVGSVCGAIPPMIGWVAATNTLDVGAWILAGVLFIWQLPHFLALAWMYRDDYARAGFAMLPSVDATGWRTALVALLTSAVLIPLCLIATITHLTGVLFAIVSIVLGAWMTWLAWRFLQQRDDLRARRLFLASITYLPLLLAMLMIDRVDTPDPVVITPAATATLAQLDVQIEPPLKQ